MPNLRVAAISMAAVGCVLLSLFCAAPGGTKGKPDAAQFSREQLLRELQENELWQEIQQKAFDLDVSHVSQMWGGYKLHQEFELVRTTYVKPHGVRDELVAFPHRDEGEDIGRMLWGPLAPGSGDERLKVIPRGTRIRLVQVRFRGIEDHPMTHHLDVFAEIQTGEHMGIVVEISDLSVLADAKAPLGLAGPHECFLKPLG